LKVDSKWRVAHLSGHGDFARTPEGEHRKQEGEHRLEELYRTDLDGPAAIDR